MSRARLVLVVLGLPIAGALSGVAACGTSSDEPAAIDAGRDAVAPPNDAGPAPDAGDASPPIRCSPVDVPPGQGKKFCELPGQDATALTVPPEFCVREFATVKEARVLRFAPSGDLFVAAPSMNTVGGAEGGPGAIVVLPDDDRDGRADAVLTFAGPSPNDGRACAAREVDPADTSCVHGLLFAGGYLYFTRGDDVRRFAWAPGARAAAGASELVAKLGGAAIADARWTHTLEQTKSGEILVSRGRADSDACSVEQMTRGAVLSLGAVGAALPVAPQVVADGFRNPMYLRCAPNSCGDCYASELSGDNWDGVGGREKLALLGKRGESWGYPCCVGRDVAAPTTGAHDCTNVGRELVAIPLHDTNFGLDFERGVFPDPYKHALFVALHGVFTSFGGTGVVWLATDPASLRPTAPPKMFMSGFAAAGNGRATDVAFAPDGRLFVADDTGGKIYWIAPRTLAAPR